MVRTQGSTTFVSVSCDNKFLQGFFHHICYSMAMKEVLENSTYQQRVSELSVVLRDNLVHPMDRAVYHIEYVMRHQGAHFLRYSYSHMSFMSLNFYLFSRKASVKGPLLAPVLLVGCHSLHNDGCDPHWLPGAVLDQVGREKSQIVLFLKEG